MAHEGCLAEASAAELAANPVDTKKAQTRREKDKATIDGFVEAMPGGFETLNATITEAIKKAAAVIAEQFSASEIHLVVKGLTAHDATVVAEILKSNTSVTAVCLNSNEEIEDEGAKALAEAIKVSATVKELENVPTCLADSRHGMACEKDQVDFAPDAKASGDGRRYSGPPG